MFQEVPYVLTWSFMFLVMGIPYAVFLFWGNLILLFSNLFWAPDVSGFCFLTLPIWFFCKLCFAPAYILRTSVLHQEGRKRKERTKFFGVPFEPRRYFLQQNPDVHQLLGKVQGFSPLTDQDGINVWASVSSSFLWLFLRSFWPSGTTSETGKSYKLHKAAP